ncbi:MAG TPA: hypothetical protein VJI32_01130 [Candidatus Nanoarchaeia archaeon]|nr:hypothetical protein [Candidatus Nanoarchaeia archaeon]
MDSFEQEIRGKLKLYTSADKMYLKKNYQHEIFTKHGVSDEEINFIFNSARIISIFPNLSFGDRIDITVQTQKHKKLKVIIQFNPFANQQTNIGKVGIITAFFI